MCRYLESIKYQKGTFFNRERHEIRMLKSTGQSFDLKKRIVKLPVDDKLYKIRVVYNRDYFKYTFIPYKKRNIQHIVWIEDNNISYNKKYEDRSCFERYLIPLKDTDEIILIKNGFITDASFSNLAFWTGTEWHTPQFPLLKGTMREKLLQEGKLICKRIRKEHLLRYQKISFINAMNDLGSLEVILEHGKL